MVNSNFSIRTPGEDRSSERSEKTKPNSPPPNDDRFRKSMKDREGKQEEIAEEDSPPSLFELSKSKKNAPSPGLKKSESKENVSSPNLKKSEGKKEGALGLSKKEPLQAEVPDEAVFEGGDGPFLEERSEEGESEVSEHLKNFFSDLKGKETKGKLAETVNQPTDSQPTEKPSKKTSELSPFEKPEENISKKHPSSEGSKVVQESAALLPGEMETSQKKKIEGSRSHLVDTKTSSKKESKEEKKVGDVLPGSKKEVEGGVFSAPSSVEFRAEKASAESSVSRASQIADLVTELVKKIEVMQKGGETHTTITLSHPPAFKDATITLTNTESAKREFNVSFANLSPEGKALLDQALKDNSLSRQMEKRDIVIHVVTTSTEPQTLFNVESSSGSSRDRGGEGQQQQKGGGQQQREREKEQKDEE